MSETRVTYLTEEEARRDPRWASYFRAQDDGTLHLEMRPWSEYRDRRNAQIAEKERDLARWLDDGGQQ